MFCTKCGSEMPDGTEFCTNCGARMGAASPAAASAEPASMPAAGMPPVQHPVQKKSHKRAVIIGACVAGVLVAGGAALALTGVLGPLGQGNSSQITVLGSDEGSAEHKDKGSAKEKPAADEDEAEEPEETGSSVKVDLNDQATYAAANLFLSNFTEEQFARNSGDGLTSFDATDGLSAEEKRGMTIFVFNHLLENTTNRVEKGGDVDGKSYTERVPVDSMRREMSRLFGVTLSDDEMHIDADDGLPDNLATRATVQDGYLYFNEMHGFAGSPIPAIVTTAEDLGDNMYCLTFEAYVARSYNGISSPLISDVPESVYGLPADQLKSTIGADSAPMMSGTAVVKVAAGDSAPSFALQSINYD